MQQISIDKPTQVNNRQNLLGFMDYKLRNHDHDVYLMMMDLDSFKQINDTYGHVEGDNALVNASKGIKEACGGYVPRPYIARYGGAVRAADEHRCREIYGRADTKRIDSRSG